MVILTASAWGFIAWQHFQQAPIRGHIAAGRDYATAGQGSAAEKEWRAALQIAPQNAEAWQLLGEYYFAIENWPEAKNAFEQVTKIEPQTPLVVGSFSSGIGASTR